MQLRYIPQSNQIQLCSVAIALTYLLITLTRFILHLLVLQNLNKDLQRRSRLETVSETVSVSTSRRNRDRGVSRPVLSLTKPQDKTKTRQTSLVSDRLETVSVLFFLFLGDTRNEPFARPRTKSREGGK
ncbi:hypothetical protein PROFUN_03705 [Planoprotostelium fungivorum]|uniref:Uncharacterized protein n=1 Tax=Planoprotostelium fungivorum TaxID=1890364 RepID=A0A2P6NDK7_9EUKA|nr:hypothetical protein PROFUN_03705 [Planoprotostelium fungivorum]